MARQCGRKAECYKVGIANNKPPPFWDGLHHLFMVFFGGGLLLIPSLRCFVFGKVRGLLAAGLDCGLCWSFSWVGCFLGDFVLRLANEPDSCTQGHKIIHILLDPSPSNDSTLELPAVFSTQRPNDETDVTCYSQSADGGLCLLQESGALREESRLFWPKGNGPFRIPSDLSIPVLAAIALHAREQKVGRMVVCFSVVFGFHSLFSMFFFPIYFFVFFFPFSCAKAAERAVFHVCLVW